MKHSAPPARKEDYKVLIDLHIEKRKFTFPCKIFLPENIQEHPQIYIFPSKWDFETLPRLRGKCWFVSANKDNQINVVGEDVHVSGGNMVHWGDGLEDGYLKVFPKRLLIYQVVLSSDKNIIWFQLSPSHQLAPHESRLFHYDGSAKVCFSNKKTFDLTNDLSVTFMNRYKWLKDGKDRNVTFPELIAEAEFLTPIEEHDVEKYIKLLDDFLLLVSFAEGHRVALPRLQICYPDKICDIYRMNYSIPNLPENHSFNSFRIHSNDFDQFIKKTWGRYQGANHPDLIKSALVSQVTDIQHSMESRYLSLFSGIETLLLGFRLDNDLEFVVSDICIWNIVKKQIKDSIKKQNTFELKKEERKCLYNNIEAINRVPLHKVFEIFATKKNIYTADLWNFFGDKNSYSLTAIRNRLTHGYGINERYFASFSVALKNLELYANRMLLVELGWVFEKSTSLRQNNFFVDKWQSAREEITQWR